MIDYPFKNKLQLTNVIYIPFSQPKKFESSIGLTIISMEQYSKYLTWLNKSQDNITKNSYSYSWEEEAFAEDGRGPLGGFVWPPRSYLCTFCRREFRSAQALGGHMNVHRRERAKLKQSLSCSQQNPKSLLEYAIPSFFPPPDSPSRVSLIPKLGLETTTFGSNSDAMSCVCDEVQVLGSVETNLYLGIDGCEDEEVTTNCKRQKTMASPLMKLASMEDQVDLELRLAR